MRRMVYQRSENMEEINPILKRSVERYLKKSKYPNIEDVCAILGIGEKEEKAKLDVGDEISFLLKNGNTVHAIAVKKELDGMLFCFLNCLEKCIPMSESDECDSYEESDVRKYLCENVYPTLPENIKESLVPFENGDLLRIPTEKEVFGKNEYGEEEPESVTQWEPMKRAVYRNAAYPDEIRTVWCWLKNKSKDCSFSFVTETDCGMAHYGESFYRYGVRPVFKIKIQNLTAQGGECKGE